MFYTQSDIKTGHRPFVAAAGLIGKEGSLVVLESVSGVPTLRLPAATTDIPTFALVDDGALPGQTVDNGGQTVEAQPLNPDQEVRFTAYGAGTAGTILVMANPVANAGAQAGQVTALPATPGVYVKVGVAEEDFQNGQLVLTRPGLELINVQSPDTLTALPFTTPTAAEVTAFRNAVAAILVAQGLMA